MLEDKLDFLNRQFTVGRFDSSGAFTVAVEHAVFKLGAYQLPRPSAWILKIVQAAVASKAGKVKVSQGKRATEISFEPSEDLLSEDLIRAFSEPDRQSSRAIKHLVTGLLCVGPGQNRAFTLSLVGGGKASKILWDGARLANQIRDIGGQKKSVVLVVKNCLSRTAQNQNADEAEELRRWAHACPALIKLDGRTVDMVEDSAPIGTPQPKFQWPYSRRDDWKCWVYVAFGTVEEHVKIPAFSVPPDLSKRVKRRALSDRLTDRRPLLSQLASSQRVSSLWRLDYYFGGSDLEGQPRRSTCRWLVDGVVIDEHHLSLAERSVALSLYLDGSDLETDLSHFSFQRESDRQRSQRIQSAFQDLSSKFLEVKTELNNASTTAGLKESLLVIGGCLLAVSPFLFLLHGALSVIFVPLSVHGTVTDLKNEKRSIISRIGKEIQELLASLEQLAGVSQTFHIGSLRITESGGHE